MFSRYSFQQQRDLEAFLEIPPECNSGPCDKLRIPIVENSQSQQSRDIAYSYKYNPDTEDIEYSFPK